MAGSNGSPAQRGAPPSHWPAETEDQARAEFDRWQQQLGQRGYPPAQPPQQAVPHPSQGYVPNPFDTPQGAQGYTHIHATDPLPGNVGGPQAPAGYAEAAGLPRGQNPFAPHFERFSPPPVDHARHDPRAGYDLEQGATQRDLRGSLDPHQRQPQSFEPRGYAAPPAHDMRHQDGQGGPESWDLSHYQPGQIPQGYPAQQGYAEPPHDARGGQPGWPPPHGAPEPPQWQHAAAQPQWSQHDPGHGHLPYGGHPQQGHYPDHNLEPGFDPRGGHHDPGLDADDFEAADEPRRGPSTLLVVGMLVGAIVVGGGLAFAYKQLGGGSGDKAKVAELKRPSSPEKVRPQDPGGKTIEHSDKKFLNRLASDQAAEPQRQSDVDGAAKKVSTIPIVVNRDGSLTPQPPAQGGGTSGVPGLVIDGFGPPPAAPQLRSESGPVAVPPPPRNLPPPAPAVVKAAPAAPKVAELPLPKVISQPAATAAVEKAPPPAKKQRTAARDDLMAPQSGPGEGSGEAPSGLGSAVAAPPRKPVAASSGSGYVAVLASKKSRQDALNSFADLHSQYPDVLGGMTPDVREANLGDKGVWYRLIVGPPGSREAARNVCVKLKDKGFKDCWPVAY